MIWTAKFDTWWLSALSIILFAAIVYPLLSVLDKKPWFSTLMTERKNGEMKQSMLLVFGMFTFVITICWGLFGERVIAICAIYAWGFGDAFISVILVLLYRGGMAWYGSVITAGVTALVSTLVELYSLKGRDTVTCPIAAMAVLIPLIHLFGGEF